MIQKMLIANDGSAGGEQALKAALDLARRLGLPLAMVCVQELPSFPATLEEIVEEEKEQSQRFVAIVERAKERADEQGVAFEAHVLEGQAVPSIVDFIKTHGYDLLVIGFMGHSALYNRVIGGTTDRLVEYAPCQVMVVK